MENEIIFIEDLVVKRVPDTALYSILTDEQYFQYSCYNCDPDFLNYTIQEKYVPVTTFFNLNREKSYRNTNFNPKYDRVMIAYSEEVEELLGVPIRLLIKEKQQAVNRSDKLTSELNQYKSMNFWKRLKFLFVGTKLFEEKMFKGKIKYAKIYPYALTKEQVSEKYKEYNEKV